MMDTGTERLKIQT